MMFFGRFLPVGPNEGMGLQMQAAASKF